MNFIDKISLKDSNDKDAVLYDNELSDEQKVIMYNEIFKKQLLQNQPKAKTERKLLLRVWSSIENLPKPQQNQARDLIRKIENFPNLTINPRFEMIYKDVPQHGTNIIQLILNHVSDGVREILPGQDLFENIAAYNERLVYAPGITSKTPVRSVARNLSKHSIIQLSTPRRTGNKVLLTRNLSKQSTSKYLTPRRPVNRRSTSFNTFSPISSCLRRQNGYQEQPR